MKISKNFSLHEFTASATAGKYKIDNTPTEDVIENLIKLVNRVLQPLRNEYGKAMTVSSGYRSPELNAHPKIKGVPNSQHVRGQAADIAVPDPRNLLATLLRLALAFDQAILYDDGRNSFLHISYNSGHNRKQVLYSKNTKP